MEPKSETAPNLTPEQIERIKVPGEPAEKGSEKYPFIFVGPEGKNIRASLLAQHGVYSLVYVGRYEGGGADSVVVKKAKEWFRHEEGLRTGTKETFDKEVQVLRNLEKHGSTHTPKVHYYHPGSEQDLPYFVMDLAKGVKLDIYNLPHYLYTLKGETLGKGIDEDLALDIATQFAEIESVAHKAGYFNPDLKSPVWTGLFWDPEKHHLTVIDWNVVREANNQTKNWSIKRVGALLRHLLVGGASDEVLRSLTSPEVQTILDRCSGSVENQQYQDIDELLGDLRKLKQIKEPASIPTTST